MLTSEVDDRTGQPRPLRPEIALDRARAEVLSLCKQGLLLGRAVQFDPITDWYLIAWDALRAAEFPADEARKLALALGLDLEKQVIGEKRLVAKKGSSVRLQEPGARRKRDVVDPEKEVFRYWIDAVHTAMLVYQEDGPPACKAFLQRSRLLKDATFRSTLQALLNAIPRARLKGKFVCPEAEVLEALRLAFFDDLATPPEELPEARAKQLEIPMLGGRSKEEEVDDEEDTEESDD
ncbi:MAG: hypothetical protein HYZ53_04930 [Planctomycetes bacterium]|nr:hypothetical protein [Planctomycetota bacterium]